MCDSTVSEELVEIFGEANVLAASKTPLCVKLECLLGCTVAMETVHSDAICLACLRVLEAIDGVDAKRKVSGGSGLFFAVCGRVWLGCELRWLSFSTVTLCSVCDILNINI